MFVGVGLLEDIDKLKIWVEFFDSGVLGDISLVCVWFVVIVIIKGVVILVVINDRNLCWLIVFI